MTKPVTQTTECHFSFCPSGTECEQQTTPYLWQVALGEPVIIWITGFIVVIMFLLIKEWVTVIGLCCMFSYIALNGKRHTP